MTKRLQLGLTFLFLFPALVFAPSGATAQPGAHGPDDLTIVPDGLVDVRQLPPPARGIGTAREMPRHFPDRELLLQHKQALERGGPGAPPAPSPEAVVPPTSTPPGAVTGTTGLRQSESGGWYPPDTQIAAGPSHLFEAVNIKGRILTKSPLATVSTFDLNPFFGLSNSVFTSDPKVRFDPLSGRWFALLITVQNPAGAWKLAVSTSDDPTGAFCVYTIRSKSGTFPDFPALGISNDKVVLTANAFSLSGVFQGTEFVVLNKIQLTACTTASGQFFGPPQGLFTIQPAHSLSSIGTLYMAAVAFNSASSMRIWSVNGVPGVGAGVTFTTVNRTIATLSSPPDARQGGTSALIETNDNRLLDAVYRNGSFWVGANSACSPNGDTAVRACLRLMQVDTSSLNVIQTLDVGDSGKYLYYPAIQTDGSNNLIGVFSRSSSIEFASVYASGQLSGAPGTFGTPVPIQAGASAYTPSQRRFGDYSGAAIDPSDPTKIWVAGEYALGASEWGTAIAEVGF